MKTKGELKMKAMKCSICKGKIAIKGNWKMGNNAEPVVEYGRCCDLCNATVVVPARLNAAFNSVLKKHKIVSK